MPRGKSNQNAALLEYALGHLEREHGELQEKINHIRRQLGTTSETATAASADEAKPKRRPLSAAARRRIAAAQKRRWAEQKKANAAAS